MSYGDRGCVLDSNKFFSFHLDKTDQFYLKVDTLQIGLEQEWRILQPLKLYPKIFSYEVLPFEGGILVFGADSASLATSFRVSEDGKVVRENRQKFEPLKCHLQSVWRVGKKKLELHFVGSSFQKSINVLFDGKKWLLL